MTTIAQLEARIIELEVQLDRIKSTVKLATGLDPDEVWVSSNAAATSLGISVYLLKQIIGNAESRRLAQRDTQLQYGVHYRQKAGTKEGSTEWQFNITKFKEWFNLPPEKRDQ